MADEEPINNSSAFLSGGGEMGKLTRAYDWSKSTLGEPGGWPQSLKTTLSILLNSKFPMFLFWGAELTCFYNDAYRPSLGQHGKHPVILGMPAEQAWPEIWAVIQPLISQVLAGGEATWSEDQLIPIYRNGVLEDVYWTFSYSPVTDESGKPAGVFVTCTETTDKMGMLKHLKESNEELRQSMAAEALAWRKVKENEKNLAQIIMQAPVAIAIFRGPEYVIEIANQRALELWGRKLSSIINKPVLDAMPELRTQGVKELLDNVYTTGETFSATEFPIKLLRNGQMSTVYINFVYEALYDFDGVVNGLITIGIELTDQVISRKKIEESEEKLRQAIETGSMGVWSIEPVTLKVTMSDFVKDMLGLPLDREAEMEDIMRAIDPEYHEMLTDVLKNAIENHQASDTEYSITNLVTGAKRWVRATGKVFLNAHGEATEYSGMFMDITERKLDELRKSDFIGMVSHELKTPLTSLSAYVQMLQAKTKKIEDEFVSLALDKVNIQVKKMTGMINGFLNISRLESGKIHLEKQDFDLRELLSEMVADIKLTASTHVITLVPGHAIQINADADKIGSVLSNLLSNAIKYSPKGKYIEVKCDIAGDFAQVSVKDEGMGIKPNDIDKIFDRYYRVETNHTKHISGFGIGLYLSAEIIRRHGGTIWAESESGVGSTFCFTLPLSI